MTLRIAGARTALLPLLLLLLLAAGCASPEERLQEFLNDADRYLEDGEPELALVQARNALRLDPDSLEAEQLSVRIHREREDWASWRKALERVIELSPEDLDANLTLADAYVQAGNLELASPLAARLAKLAPEDPRALVIRAEYLLRSGNAPEARVLTERALALAPENERGLLVRVLAALAGDDREAALTFAETGVARQPGSVALRILHARLLRDAGRVEEAIASLTALIAAEPDVLAHRESLAAFHLSLGDRAAAEAVLRKAVEDLPDDLDAKLQLARFLAEENPSDAIALLRRYVDGEGNGSSGLAFALAGLYVRTGDLGSADAVYGDIARSRGDDPLGLQATTARARIAADQADAAQARGLVDQVLAADPGNPDARLVASILDLRDGRVSEAIAGIRTVLRENQENTEALTILGAAYLLDGRRDLARDSFEAAVYADPDNPIAVDRLSTLLLEDGAWERAEAILEPVVAAGRGDAAATRKLVRVKLELGKPEEARRWAGAVAELEGDPNVEAYVAALGKLTGSEASRGEAELRALVEDDPDYAPAVRALVEYLATTGRAGEATTFLEGFVADRPEDVAARNLLARQYAAGGDWPRAVALLEATAAAHPEAVSSHANLARGYAQRGQVEEAERWFRSALGVDPDASPLLLELAVLLDGQGRTEEAEPLYRQVLELDPTADVAANNLAYLLGSRGADLDEALALARRFERSENPYLLDTLGWVHLQRGEYERAVSVLRKAQNGAPDSAEIAYHLGTALVRAGQLQDGREMLGRALASDEDFAGRGAAEALLASELD